MKQIKTTDKTTDKTIEPKNKPILKIKNGSVSCAIFSNNSEAGKYYTLNLNVGYKPKDSEEWQNKNISINYREAEAILFVLQEAIRQKIIVEE